jgi:hypothetical protein
MRFKADENPARGSGSAAVPGGHDAVTVGDEDLQGKPGCGIVAIVQRELRAFITLDLGFADIRSYPPSEFRGKVLRLILLFAILLTYYRVVRPACLAPFRGEVSWPSATALGERIASCLGSPR